MSRLLTRNLVNLRKYRTCSLSVKCYENFHHKNKDEYKNGKVSNFFTNSMGICTAVVGFSIFKDYLSNYMPSVEAKTIKKREQFNFIADVVEVAAKSLVYIEIQDKSFNPFTGKPNTISNGSGFIVSSDGLILTNAHVVINKPRSNVVVKLNDGRTFMGKVEAYDPVSWKNMIKMHKNFTSKSFYFLQTSDLATVRIQAKNLNALRMGESSSLRAGEFVVALGSPLCKWKTYFNHVIPKFQLNFPDFWSKL